MKKILLLAGVALCLFSASCKKDKSPAPVPGSNTKLLSRLTKTEAGKTTVFNFTYDPGKKLLSYKSTDNLVGIVFSYDAAGNVIKVQDTEDNYINVYTYAYSSNAPVSGSFKSWKKQAGQADQLIENDQLTYTVNNNQVTKIHVAFLQTGDAADFSLGYNNSGNLSLVTGSGNTSYTASFAYGTKKPVYPLVSKWILDQAGFSLQFAARNELLSMSFDFPGTQYDQALHTQYTYDADGYALTAVDESATVTFEYQ
jgi:hypothetical protein